MNRNPSCAYPAQLAGLGFPTWAYPVYRMCLHIWAVLVNVYRYNLP